MTKAKLTIALLLFAASVLSAGQKRETMPLPVFPFIVNYNYETKYLIQWIAGCPQYSMISASISKQDPATIEIVLTETETARRSYYSNSEARVKSLTQTGLNAHLVKIDFQTGADAEDRPAYAFGFPDEHGVPVRWRFVAYGESSDRGAGPRIQAIKTGLLVSYHERGSVAAPSSLVQVGDKTYEVEQWNEISKPPSFVAFRGTVSDGLTLGLLLYGQENWRVQSAPAGLNVGAKWTLIDDRKFVRQLEVTARQGDDLTITETGDKSKAVEMIVKTSDQGFAIKSMTQKSGANAMRITFTPEVNLFATPAPAEHTFQIDENNHQKVLQGSVTVETHEGNLVLKLKPRVDNSQVGLPRDFMLISTVSLNPAGYNLEVR
jgi:hypothetical protein